MSKYVGFDNDEEESWFLLFLDFLSNGGFYIIIILIFIFLWVVGQISNLSIFDDRVVSKTSEIQISVEFILNYQTTPQAVYQTTVIQGLFEHKTVKSWNGDLISDECSVSAQINSEKVNNLVGTANSILSDARLPLQFQQRGTDLSKAVDCNTVDFSHKVYIEVTGAEGSGDLLYIRKTGFDHEEAWVALPRNLYDLVLEAAVNQTQFTMPNYATAGWYRGQTLASVTYEAGDPNGLASWTQSWLPTLQNIYGVQLYNMTETYEVEVTVGSKWVKTGEDFDLDCDYKGRCKREYYDVGKNVPITEIRQMTRVVYYLP